MLMEEATSFLPKSSVSEERVSGDELGKWNTEETRLRNISQHFQNYLEKKRIISEQEKFKSEQEKIISERENVEHYFVSFQIC